VNDRETFAWRLQESFPGLRIRNLGANGFGTVHAYLILRHAVESGAPLPKAAVVLYNTFHAWRNTVSPAALASFRANRERFPWLRYPKSGFPPDGHLVVRLMPAFSAKANAAAEPPPEERLRLDSAILADKNGRGPAHGLNP